jgi:hypothetical protein
MDAMKLTFSGREQLRSEGWIIDEAEFEDVVDPEEYARWSADQDAQAYGEAQ